METSEDKQPWEMEMSLVEVLEALDAQIDGDAEEGDYFIHFFDPEGNRVEAMLKGEYYEGMLYEAREGAHFWIVVYRVGNEDIKASVWPIADYWHESWRKETE